MSDKPKHMNPSPHRYCVIMADGSGSPKQLRVTYDRFREVVPAGQILLVTLAPWHPLPIRPACCCRTFRNRTC